MNKFVWLIVLFSSTAGWAQYRPLGAITMWTAGYVVTMQNDTLRGDVRVGSLVNDPPAVVHLRLADSKKLKLRGDELRLVAQHIPDFAYVTGAIPRERTMVRFERVPNPRRDGKPALLERLTLDGGRIALYFDVTGWKKTGEYTFGNFSISHQQELSYVAVKDSEALVVKRGDWVDVCDRLFGDCPAFVQTYPVARRRDWTWFGDLIEQYNRRCQPQ